MSDNELKLTQTKIWSGTLFVGMILSVSLFWFFKNSLKHDDLRKFLDQQGDLSKAKAEKLEKEISNLNKQFRRIASLQAESIDATPAEINLYPDSVPCCGGGDDAVVVEESSGDALEFGSEEAIDRMTMHMTEEQKEMVEKTMRELEEFRSTLSEEDLARLEQRTAELKRRQKAQMLRMIAALPESHRRKAQRQLPMMEQAMAHPIEMQALIELEEEQKRAEIAKKSEIRKITVTPVTAEQMLEIRQQQKMKQALETLEDAARQ